MSEQVVRLSESLPTLTAGEWSLSSVNPPVCENIFLAFKPLLTGGAFKGSLVGVNKLVLGEMRRLGEPLPAHAAGERTLSGVNSLVRQKVR